MRRLIVNRFLTLLPKNKFGRNVSVLVTGTVISQLLVIVCSPLIARLYTKEQFGLLSIYTAILFLVGVLSCFRYQLAIPLLKKDQDAAYIVVLCVVANLLLFIATLCGVLIFGDRISVWQSEPALKAYLWILPISVFVLGTYQMLMFWNIRQKAFKNIATSKMTRSGSIVGVQIGASSFGTTSLILGQLLGDLLGAIRLGAKSAKLIYADLRCFSLSKAWLLAKEHKDFPLVSTWNGLCNTGSNYIPLLLMGQYFGLALAGVYGMAFKIMSAPMSILGKSVGDVFYAEAVDSHRNNTLHSLMLEVHQKLSSITIPVAIFCILVSSPFFNLYLGKEWLMVGKIAPALIVWQVANFITSPPTRIYPIIDRQKTALVFQFLLLCGGVGSVYIFHESGFLETIVCLSLVSAGVYMLRLYLSFWLVGASLFQLSLNLLKPIVFGVLMNSPLILYRTFYYPSVEFGTGYLGCTAISFLLVLIFVYTQVSKFSSMEPKK